MNTKINFWNLLRQLIPPHKRRPVRMEFIYSLITPLIPVYQDFIKWRKAVRIHLNMSSQIGKLVGYLRDRHKDEGIDIFSFNKIGFAIGLSFEGVDYAAVVGLKDEGIAAEVPLDWEVRDIFGDVDFIIKIPQFVFPDPSITREQIDLGEVKTFIDRYKLATITYKIETYEKTYPDDRN